MTANIHEPRSTTLRRHVHAYLLDHTVTMEAYADDVRALYHRRVPQAKARVLRFHEGGDASKDLAANGQLIARILSGAVRLPADLEEALVLALPEPYRSTCVADLAERYGLLPARIPQATVGDTAAGLSRLLRETGEAIEALAPILEDFRVDERDVPYAKRALKEINDALAELVSWQARITAILPDADQATPELRVVSPGRG